MIPQQIDRSPQELESRVASLETELLQVKQVLSKLVAAESPWWIKVAGSCEDDPTFDDAVRYGREWRESAR